MQHQLEAQFDCHIISWALPTEDGMEFSAIKNGQLIVADSEALLILALCPPAAPYLMAA